MLKMVTFTGADDTTDPVQMLMMSRENPWIEWGILVSQQQMGSGRFPSKKWIKNLQRIALNNPGMLNLSMHVCGFWCGQILCGIVDIPFYIADGFQRVQLNFHAENKPCDYGALYSTIKNLGMPFIFQIDGHSGNKHFTNMNAHYNHEMLLEPLFDTSGGAGILPDKWPAPIKDVWKSGYAGGLGPDNLKEQLPIILEASSGRHIWIDMETKVRTEEYFDMEKVGACVEICRPIVDTALWLP